MFVRQTLTIRLRRSDWTDRRLRRSLLYVSFIQRPYSLVLSTCLDAYCVISPCVAVPIRLPHSASPMSIPRSAVPQSRRTRSSAASSAPHFPLGPVCLARLHRAASSPRPPPRRMLQQACERDEIRVMPRSPTSCPCHYCTVRSMRRCRPPHRRASIRRSKAHVARVCFKCFRCFSLNVAKVDQNIAHVTVAIHICFKYMFQMFHLIF
jgi:hypothetical protein